MKKEPGHEDDEHPSSSWDLLQLYKHTASHMLTGVVELLAGDSDIRFLLCNSSIPFYGKEECAIPTPSTTSITTTSTTRKDDGEENKNNDLFSEFNFPQHVKQEWLKACKQSLTENKELKFTYMVDGMRFKVRVGVMMEPRCLCYHAKALRLNTIEPTRGETTPKSQIDESELRLAFDVIPSLVWCARGLEVVYGNHMWMDYGGIIGETMAEDAAKLHWHSICHPDDFQWSWERWVHAGLDGEPFDGHLRLKRRDGEDYRWFKVDAAPYTQQGDNRLWVGICTDIHEQRIQETHAIVDKAISNFLAIMSHEMRTPLTGITGLLQWLMGTSLSPEQLDCCSTISICTDSLLVMINNLLDILKLEGGKVEITNGDMSPVKITEVCVDMFSRLAEPKKVEMIYNIDLAMPDLVVSDSYRFQQVLTNLLSNAVKFTHEGGEIEVSLQLLSDKAALEFVKEPNLEQIRSHFDKFQWLQFSVRDTGMGIEKEKMPTIFRRFSQVEASLKNEPQGGGLGLAICRNIATLMHGSVTAISEREKGSQFFFTIPVGVSPNASRIFGPPPFTLNPACAIVLVANPTLRHIFQTRLTHYHLTVLTLNEYKVLIGEASAADVHLEGYGTKDEIGAERDSGRALKGRRRMSLKGGWSDLSTIVEESHEDKETFADQNQNEKASGDVSEEKTTNTTATTTTGSSGNDEAGNPGRVEGENKGEGEKGESKLTTAATTSSSRIAVGKNSPCIVFVDQSLWVSISVETQDWLKKNGKVCVVRMGQKDLKFEEGTRSLIKPVKYHMLFAECDIFLRSCELPKQPQFTPASELSRSRDPTLEALGIQFPLKVLVADDSTVNLQVASKLLQKIGYKTISTVVNGNEVLEFFRDNGPVEVVLMDMQMPGLDGCEATILLRQQYTNSVVHVIGFTATTFAEDREKCLSSGMCSFLSKPVKLSELEAELIKAWRAVNLRISCSCNKHLELYRPDSIT